MSKLLDNELLIKWNENLTKSSNQLNNVFDRLFLNIHNFELRNSTVISCREINETSHLVMAFKTIKDDYQYQIYTLSTINNFDSLVNYCIINNEYFDIIDTIVNYKVLQLVNIFSIALDQKFSNLIKNHFNVLNYKIGKNQDINFLVKPKYNNENISLLDIVNKHKDTYTPPENILIQENHKLQTIPEEVELPNINHNFVKEEPNEENEDEKKTNDEETESLNTESINTETYEQIVNPVSDIEYLIDSVTALSLQKKKNKINLKI